METDVAPCNGARSSRSSVESQDGGAGGPNQVSTERSTAAPCARLASVDRRGIIMTPAFVRVDFRSQHARRSSLKSARHRTRLDRTAPSSSSPPPEGRQAMSDNMGLCHRLSALQDDGIVSRPTPCEVSRHGRIRVSQEIQIPKY